MQLPTHVANPPRPGSTHNASEHNGPTPDSEPPPATPRWVKVFGIVNIALVVLFIILHLTGRGLGGHTL